MLFDLFITRKNVGWIMAESKLRVRMEFDGKIKIVRFDDPRVAFCERMKLLGIRAYPISSATRRPSESRR